MNMDDIRAQSERTLEDSHRVVSWKTTLISMGCLLLVGAILAGAAQLHKMSIQSRLQDCIKNPSHVAVTEGVVRRAADSYFLFDGAWKHLAECSSKGMDRDECKALRGQEGQAVHAAYCKGDRMFFEFKGKRF